MDHCHLFHRKLDDVFTNGGGVAGTFGSSTQVPVLDIDGQGRITSASLAEISTTLDIAGDTGTDTLSLIDGTLTFEGTANQIVTTVSDDKVNSIKNSLELNIENNSTIKDVRDKMLDYLDSNFKGNENFIKIVNSSVFCSKDNIISDNYKITNHEKIAIIPPIGGG